MVAPLERRLQLVTGKGGTGKTTLCAALGLAHAARGRRPVVVELGHRASLERVLGCGDIGHAPVEVAPGLFGTNVDGHEAARELIQRALPSRATARALRVGAIRHFLDAAPGVGELATLDRIRHLVDETDFDPILVDGDATGHTRMLFMLDVVLRGLGVSGAVAEILDRTSHLFADPETAAVHVASLPTALAVEETLELWTELRASGRVAMGHVLLDRVEGVTASLPPARLAQLEARAADVSEALASAIGLLRVASARAERTRALEVELGARAAHPRVVAEVDLPRLDVATLRQLGEALLAPGGPGS